MSQALAHTCPSCSKSHPHLFTGSVHTLGLDEVLWQKVSSLQGGRGKGEAVVESMDWESRNLQCDLCSHYPSLASASSQAVVFRVDSKILQFHDTQMFSSTSKSPLSKAQDRKAHHQHPPTHTHTSSTLTYESCLVWVTEQKRNIQWHELELVN